MTAQASLFDAPAAGPDDPGPIVDPAANYVTLHRDAKPTEKLAGSLAFPHSGTARMRVLRFIVVSGDHGATDEEVQLALDMNPSTERPRRDELARGGWIRRTGRTRPFRSGATGDVWVATQAAHDRLAAGR